MTYSSTGFLAPLEDAKEYLKVTDNADDSRIGFVMEGVAAEFNRITNRTLVSATLTEYYNGEDSASLFLRSYPVTSDNLTIEVYLDDDNEFAVSSQLDSGELWIDQTVGMIKRIGGAFDKGTRNVKVVYTAGYTSIPGDLRLAYLDAVTVAYKRMVEKRADVSTMSKGDTTYTYIDQDYPQRVLDTLRVYTRHA